MSVLRLALAAAVLAAALSPAQAKVEVFACEPEWAALAEEIGGRRIEAFSATTGRQDPHDIQARPSLIARMRQADVAICTGAGLEESWLPLLFRQAANAKLQPWMPNYIEAARFVRMLDVPASVDRSHGHVHAAGNPHIQVDPRTFLPVAEALTERLAAVDPAGALVYRERRAAFAERWREAIADWERRAAPLRGSPVLVQHKDWAYLLDWLGMVEVAALEPRPGVAPGPAHLAELLRRVGAARPRMTLVAAYQDDRPARWIAERAGTPVVRLPTTVGGTDEASSLRALFEQIVERLLAALSAG